MNSARLLALAGAAIVLAGCANNLPTGSARSQVPIPSSTMALMASQGMSPSDPILIRAYKKELEMELWKRGRDGRYALLKTLPNLPLVGASLGPRSGRETAKGPEGFYTDAGSDEPELSLLPVLRHRASQTPMIAPRGLLAHT